ncbi:MAG: alkaline phosphatase D family protein [Pseudomonadota bacterium]
MIQRVLKFVWIALVLSPIHVWAAERSLPFVIAFGSCNDQDREQPLWKPLTRMAPDLFVFLGDNVYADTDDEAEMRAVYARQNQVPGFKSFKQSVALEGIWDDHDFGVNDGGSTFAGRDMSQQALLDFLGEADRSPRRTRQGIFDVRYFEVTGQEQIIRVQLLLLDTRYFKSPWNRSPSFFRRYDPDDSADKTLLGQAQWRWLERELGKPADLRVIASGVQVLNAYHGDEHWALFPHERERLFELIRSTSAKGVVLLSGDRHFAEISRRDDILDYPLYDFTSSGMTHSFKQGDRTVNPDRIAVYTGLNFGSMTINADHLVLRIHNRRGRAVEAVRIRMEDLGLREHSS